ncbi:hypothetical protein [Amorphus sp. MBR-141]
MSHRMIAASALAAGLALGPAAPLHAQTLMEEMADEAAWEEQREAAPKVCFAVPASAGFQRVDAPAGTVFYKADVAWAAQWSAGPGWPPTGSAGYTGQEDKPYKPGLFSDAMNDAADPAKRGPKRTFVARLPYGALLMWANDSFVYMDAPYDYGKQYAVPGGAARSVFFGINEAKDQLGDNVGDLSVCAFYKRG